MVKKVRRYTTPSSSHQSSSSGLTTPGRSTKADMAPYNRASTFSHITLHGLNTAWMRAQDRSKWRQLVETAVLTDGRATSMMMMIYNCFDITYTSIYRHVQTDGQIGITVSELRAVHT